MSVGTRDSVRDMRYGKDPYFDGWLLHFMTENNIEPSVNPNENASLEQLRFMVDIEDDQVFAPCSDAMLQNLLSRELSPALRLEYREKWRILVHLVHNYVQDRTTRKKIYAISRHKIQQILHFPFLIPSRFLKQLLTIFMATSGLHDPMAQSKAECNARALAFARSPAMQWVLYTCLDAAMPCTSLDTMRWQLDAIELCRLARLSLCSSIWGESAAEVPEGILHDVTAPWPELAAALERTLRGARGLKILYLPDKSGEIVFDILFIQALVRLGHRVTLAVKEGFHLDTPTIWDVERDPSLKELLDEALLVDEPRVSKNDLLRLQRESPLIVITDGSRERLNLWRTSVTFARSWKEADLIIAKGVPHWRRLVGNSHLFTRDVLCIYQDEAGNHRVVLKGKSPRVTKITEAQIRSRAEAIIATMRAARSQGKQVMFYSAIIGSIPGQIQTAIDVVSTFVGYLRSKFDNLFIINPAEHFVEGMDGDDLMYMWERVQRSGYIDIWRFQTVEDIEKSFELMQRPVPAEWHGKDATFSTGCTKEMHIALDVQSKHPEMQIIGPDPKRFFRRREYGVGSYFDARLGRREEHPVDGGRSSR
jgi:uncharacterized protein with ATP-grasp and redox domains